MSTHITPTVGRIVWFRGVDGCTRAAIVTAVYGPFCLNLHVFGISSGDTEQGYRSMVTHADPEQEPGCLTSWHWMPYQIGQAKKLESAPSEPQPPICNSRVAPGCEQFSDSDIESAIQAKGKTAPRVTPDHIQATIRSAHYFTAEQGEKYAHYHDAQKVQECPKELGLLTFCVLVLKNGFTVTGESACASPENFDAEIGRNIAYDNAFQKIWMLEGYALKQKLHDAAVKVAPIGCSQPYYPD